jgi:hypothetical protein
MSLLSAEFLEEDSAGRFAWFLDTHVTLLSPPSVRILELLARASS